jgi:putative oxidoreductase
VYVVTRKDAAMVPARAALGASMLYHGLSKLRGDGLAQTAGFFEQLGIRPARTWATAAGAAEVLAGATAIAGFATRIGALAVIATQAVAIAKVHRGKGFDVVSGGWEYNVALIAIAAGLLLAGPGAVSAHEVVERRVKRRKPWQMFAPARSRAFEAVMAVK